MDRNPRPKYICAIHNFQTTSINRWVDHQGDPLLEHRITGCYDCKHCSKAIVLTGELISKMDKVECMSCHELNDFKTDILKVPEGRPMTADEYYEFQKTYAKYLKDDSGL